MYNFIYEYTPFLEHKVPQLIHLNTLIARRGDTTARGVIVCHGANEQPTTFFFFSLSLNLTRKTKDRCVDGAAWPRCAVVVVLCTGAISIQIVSRRSPVCVVLLYFFFIFFQIPQFRNRTEEPGKGKHPSSLRSSTFIPPLSLSHRLERPSVNSSSAPPCPYCPTEVALWLQMGLLPLQ